MTSQAEENNGEASERSRLALEILDALKGIRFGAVEIVVHDGKVTQIQRKERFRFGGALKP